MVFGHWARKKCSGCNCYHEQRDIRPDDGIEVGTGNELSKIKVPDRKAADAAPRIHPYSSGLPAKCGLPILTVNASAIDVVGASAAAWTREASRTNQKVDIAKKAAAAAAPMRDLDRGLGGS